MKILLLFLDGVGIGKKDSGANPFCAARLPALRSILGGELPTLHNRTMGGPSAIVLPVDATLGVPGLPQSGTGQTALFTGENAAKLIGRHFGPHPYSTLRPLIKERSIFQQTLDAGKKPCFANAFPQRFFDYAEKHPTRLSFTTLACSYAGLPLRRAEDLRAGRGISADITNAGWHALGYPDIGVITPAEAGKRVVHLLRDHDLVLFEYWRTDYAGHSRSMQESIAVLETFDGMLAGIVDQLDTRSVLLVVTSDHGNIEDLTTKTHTRNPVPLILFGHRHEEVMERLSRHGRQPVTLCEITPTLLGLLDRQR